jgi:MFS transporter, SP family, sugar:H+ symporter
MSKDIETKPSSTPQILPRDAKDKTSNFRVFLFTMFVAFGGFLFGYDCIIGGPLLETGKFKQDFGFTLSDGQKGFSAAIKGLFVSILSIGTFCGALTSPFLCDRWGRKKGLIITCFIFSVGIAFQTVGIHLALLMVGRYIAGFGVGCVSLMVPLYQSECVPARRRGTIVSCYQFAITFGLLIGQIVITFTEGKTSSASYRIPIALQFVWSTVLGFGMLLLPETPRFLIRANRWDEAVKAKSRLSGLPIDHPYILEELNEIKANLEHEMILGPATYKQCWQGTNLRRTLLGVFMQAWQQRIRPLHLG